MLTKYLGDCPNICLCFEKSIVQRAADNIVHWNCSEHLLDFSKIIYFFPTVCSVAIFSSVFSLWVKEALFLACTTVEFLPFPQPVQRMSYSKGQDGEQSQVTSFYQSTPQTSVLPSCVRQKAVLFRSTGKLPHQSYNPHKPWLSCLTALTTALGENPLLLNCLWIISAAVKEASDSVDCHWFVTGWRCLNINIQVILGTIQLKDRLQRAAAQFSVHF